MKIEQSVNWTRLVPPSFFTTLVLTAATWATLTTASHAIPGPTPSPGLMVAECSINGQPAKLVLQYETIENSGITWGPGPRPEITGVLGFGDYTYYWSGYIESPAVNLDLGGENSVLTHYDQTVWHREGRIFMTWTDETHFYLEVFEGQFPPGRHYCVMTYSGSLEEARARSDL